MLNVPYGQMKELRMQLLEKAAVHSLPCIDILLVNRMTRHCARAVAAAQRGDPMRYGCWNVVHVVYCEGRKLAPY